MTGKPSAVTAEPTTEKTAGQQWPTRASGTRASPGANGAPNVAVTPVWSATSSGSQSTVTLAVLSCTAGNEPGPSTPAAMASTDRIAVDASSTVTTGMPPSTVHDGNVNRMSIQMSESGTLSVTTPSAFSSSRAPVDGCVALRFSLACHSSGAPMRCTGLMEMRPAHDTSGESSTTASGPTTSARAWRRDTTDAGCSPDASTWSIEACSKRSSNSPTGSSTRVMPATDWVPGMMQTWSAAYRASWACHSESLRHQRRTSLSMTGTKLTGLPIVLHSVMKNGTSAGCSLSVSASG